MRIVACVQIVAIFNKSALQTERLREAQIKVGAKERKLQQDVDTRFYGTHMMINSFCTLRKAIQQFFIDHPTVASKKELSSDEWDNARDLEAITAMGASVIKAVEGDENVSLATAVEKVRLLQGALVRDSMFVLKEDQIANPGAREVKSVFAMGAVTADLRDVLE